MDIGKCIGKCEDQITTESEFPLWKMRIALWKVNFLCKSELSLLNSFTKSEFPQRKVHFDRGTFTVEINFPRPKNLGFVVNIYIYIYIYIDVHIHIFHIFKLGGKCLATIGPNYYLQLETGLNRQG